MDKPMVTMGLLSELGACPTSVNVFFDLFGDHVEVTADNVLKAEQCGLAAGWLATQLMPNFRMKYRPQLSSLYDWYNTNSERIRSQEWSYAMSAQLGELNREFERKHAELLCEALQKGLAVYDQAYPGYTVLVWPDHSWCHPEDLTPDQEGTDYMSIIVPGDVEDVDEYLQRVRPQDPGGNGDEVS